VGSSPLENIGKSPIPATIAAMVWDPEQRKTEMVNTLSRSELHYAGGEFMMPVNLRDECEGAFIKFLAGLNSLGWDVTALLGNWRRGEKMNNPQLNPGATGGSAHCPITSWLFDEKRI
jgi:hypothetical protein